jgi:hypothetical protein
MKIVTSYSGGFITYFQHVYRNTTDSMNTKNACSEERPALAHKSSNSIFDCMFRGTLKGDIEK